MPELFKRDGNVWARIADRECRLQRSHQDKRRHAFWRGVDDKGKPLTPWLFTAVIAALQTLRD